MLQSIAIQPDQGAAAVLSLRRGCHDYCSGNYTNACAIVLGPVRLALAVSHPDQVKGLPHEKHAQPSLKVPW